MSENLYKPVKVKSRLNHYGNEFLTVEFQRPGRRFLGFTFKEKIWLRKIQIEALVNPEISNYPEGNRTMARDFDKAGLGRALSGILTVHAQVYAKGLSVGF